MFFVEFEPLSRTFSCEFIGQHLNDIISCEITYGAVYPTDQRCLVDNYNNIITRRVDNSVIVSDTVTIVLPELEHTDSQLCFTAIGKTRTFTIAVEGTFKTGILL